MASLTIAWLVSLLVSLVSAQVAHVVGVLAVHSVEFSGLKEWHYTGTGRRRRVLFHSADCDSAGRGHRNFRIHRPVSMSALLESLTNFTEQPSVAAITLSRSLHSKIHALH